VCGIAKRSRPSEPDPDLFIFGFPGIFRGYFPGYSKLLTRGKSAFTWAILKGHTGNTRGRVSLRSADPSVPPRVDFAYFERDDETAARDREALVDGIEFVRGILARGGTEVVGELLPGPQVATREALARYVEGEAWGHHASCSNKMGPASDPMAVVDGDFKVHGTRGLRIVDASVFPRIPGFFIVSAIYMIAEKASDRILAEAGAMSPR
jgi:choline dehydrogenase